jgi:hypothetical protein
VYGRQIAFEGNMFRGDSNEVSFSKSVGSSALTDWVVYLSQTAAAQSSADFVIDTAVGTSSCSSAGLAVEMETDP